MKKIVYQTQGTCSRQITVSVDDNEIIRGVEFVGGCNGNLKGISQLVTGMKVDDVIVKLRGTQCGMKGTSCPDQLSRALEEIKRQ